MRIGEYDFWPRGDDTYSKSARLNTVLAGTCSIAWILFALSCIAIVRSICSC